MVYNIKSGLVQDICWSILKGLLVLCYVLSITDADLLNKPLEAQVLSPVAVPLTALAMPELPQPSNLPLFHKARQKLLAPHGAPGRVPTSAQPPHYGPFITSSPPSSSRLLKLSMKKSGSVPLRTNLPPRRLSEIAPTQPSPTTLPAALAQPPLSTNISSKLRFSLIHFLEARTVKLIIFHLKMNYPFYIFTIK